MAHEGLLHKLQFPEDKRQGPGSYYILYNTLPLGWTVQIVLAMERLMYLLTEWSEVFCPSFARSVVGIFGIELEPITFCKAIEHGVDHIVHLNEEATINARMVYQPLPERIVDLLISRNIQIHIIIDL